MNKLFTKIAALALGAAMAVGVGVAIDAGHKDLSPAHATSVSGEGTGSLTFDTNHKVSSSGDTISDTKSASWTFTTDSSYIALDAGSIHTGSSSKTCSHQTWTTGDYSGVKITSVVINAKMASGSGVSVSATINGNNIESAKSITASAADYTFTNTNNYSGGNLIIKAYRSSASKKAIYVYSITVNFASSGKTETATTITAAGSKTTLDVTTSPADTVQLTATAKAGSTTVTSTASNFTWTSSQTGVATVSSAGLVTAVAKGTTTISAQYKGDSTYEVSTGQISISVTDPNETVFDFGALATANSWINGNAYTPVVVDGTSLSTNSGGNNAKYYTSDQTWRMYNGGSLTITPASGKSITAVSSNPEYTFAIASDGSNATASFTASTNFKSITVTLAQAKTLDTITAVVTDSSKKWRVNDVVSASDLTVTPHYTDGTDGTPITNGSGVTVTNGTLSVVGSNTVNVSYGGKSTTVSVSALSSTIVAWTTTGSIGETAKSTAYNLSGLTLHGWYDAGKTDEASSSVIALYQLVADPSTAGSSPDPDNVIDVKVQLKSDSSIVYTFEDVSAPIVNSPKGSQDNPYNVSEAMAAAIAQGSTASSETYYVVGYVAYKASNNQIFLKGNPDEIDASTAPSTEEKYAMLCVYKSGGITGVGDVSVGDQVTVSGNTQYYNSNQPEFNSGAIASYVAETMTIGKTVSSETLTINSAFSYSGTVSIDYTHKTDVANANSIVTFSGYNMATVGNQTITISYSDTALVKEASTTYTLTVQYATVTTVTLNHHNLTVEPVSETTFSVTLNAGVDPSSTATWNLANDAGSSLDLNNYDVSSTGNLTATLTCIGDSSDNGVLIVTATVGSVSDTCIVTVTGDAYVTFNKESVDGIVGASIGNTVTVATVGMTPNSWTWSVTSGSNVASVSGNTATATLTFLAAGTANLHVVVSDGSDSAEGDIAVNVIKSLNTITDVASGTATWTSADSIAIHPSGSSNDPVDNDIDENIHFAGDKGTGTTDFRHWSDGIRCYAGNSVTFTPSNGAVIKTITLPTVGGECSDTQATKSGDVWTIKNGSSAITFSSLSKGTISSNIVVTYEIAGGNIANTNYNAQKAVIEFAEDLTSRLNAVCLQGTGGTTVIADLNSAWTNIQSTYNTKRNALSSGDQTVFDKLVSKATANESGDDLQRALRSYEWVYAKYHESLSAGDFLHETSGRGAVSYSSTVNPLSLLTDNSGTEVAIIVVTSMIGLSAVGGYFFLRKRKENI